LLSRTGPMEVIVIRVSSACDAMRRFRDRFELGVVGVVFVSLGRHRRTVSPPSYGPVPFLEHHDTYADHKGCVLVHDSDDPDFPLFLVV
jgi:hypothetical protein